MAAVCISWMNPAALNPDISLTSKFCHLWSAVWNSLQLALCDSSYTEHFQTETENTFLGVVAKLRLMPLWNLHDFDVVS